MSDFVKELRGLADCDARAGEPLGKAMRKAADTIEALQAENDGLTKAAADVILGAVLIPSLPGIEGVKQEIMDRLRFMIDHDDIAAAAARVRAALTTQEKPMTDLKTEWERRADLEAEERRMKQIAEADGRKP